MVPPLRLAIRLGLGVALAAWASAALSADYVVVRSNHPAITRGQAYDAGARIALPAGRSLVLMHASGAMVTLKGSPSGALAPPERAAGGDADRLATLRFILSDADKPATRQAMRTRGGICPAPDALTSLDAIAQAHQAGCVAAAGEALETWLAARASATPAP